MSTLSTNWPTLTDWASRLDPNGSTAQIAEMLNLTNEMLDDIPWVEGNLPTGHQTTARTGLPHGTWRKLYGGVQPTKSRTAQVTESCGMLESYAEVDKKLAELNGNTAAFRLSEDKPHIEGMSQDLQTALIYGNEATAPEQITGLSPRYNDQAAGNGENLLFSTTKTTVPDSTDNSSIWLVGWSPETIFGIFPKGSKAGITMEDKGQVTIENIDGSGGRMEAYRTHYALDCGLCVRDWRYAVRIFFDAENLTMDHATGPNLPELMIQAAELLPSLTNCRPVYYMNRNTRTFLRGQIKKDAAYNLTFDTVAGKRVVMYNEIPVKRVDAILNTEGAAGMVVI